jgi:hypothetical protein
MRTASTLIREAAYSLLELSGDLEKIEKIEAKPKLLFLAQTYHPAYPMEAIFESYHKAIRAIQEILKGDLYELETETFDSGWVFYRKSGSFVTRVATLRVKQIGSWDEFGTKTLPSEYYTTKGAE